MRTKKPLYAAILVLSGAIKLHGRNRTSERRMTLGRGPADAFRMHGAFIGRVWTSKPCRKLKEEPFGPRNRHERVEMHAFFLPLPTETLHP